MTPAADASSLTDRQARLVEEFRRGEPRGLSRAISAVEDETPGFEALLDALHGEAGRARRVGITGPPGAGKSTLLGGLALRYRDEGHGVGIVAVDPTSPFTGGALLGDRIRMRELFGEPGIFIRSMATRGSAGGLATTTREVADLMDAFGLERILVETVGVGQSELEIAGSADTTAVVLMPESGDGIQAMKAGLMEVADVFVVNKADRPGAGRLAKELQVSARLREGRAARGSAGHHGAAAGAAGDGEGEAGGREGEDAGPDAGAGGQEGVWHAPVLECVATEGEGIGALAEALEAHFRYLEESSRLLERRRRRLLEQARSVLARRVERRVGGLWDERIGEFAEALAEGRISPYAVARALEGTLTDGPGGPGADDGDRGAPGGG